MAKRTILDVDLIAEPTKDSFDSEVTSSILSSNNAAFASSLAITGGILAAVIGPKPIKALTKVAVHFVGKLIKGFVSMLIDTKNIFKNLWGLLKGVGKGIWNTISFIGKIIAAPFKGLARLYDIIKNDNLKEFIKDTYKTLKDGVYNKLKKFGNWFVYKKNIIITRVNKSLEGMLNTIVKMGDSTKIAVKSIGSTFKTGLVYYKEFGMLASIKKAGVVALDLGKKMAKGFLEYLTDGIKKLVNSVKKGIKLKWLKSRGIGNADELLRKDIGKNMVRELDNYNKLLKEAKSAEEITELTIGKKALIKDITKDSKWLKFVRATDSVVGSIPIIAEVLGFFTGSVIDAIDFHSRGYSWAYSISVAVFGNAVGSIAGLLTNLIPGVGPFISTVVDVFATDFVESLFIKDMSPMQTSKDIWFLIKTFGKFMWNTAIVEPFNKVMKFISTGFTFDTSAMENNLNNIDEYVKNNKIFTSIHISKLLENINLLPGITGISTETYVNGTLVDDDAGEMSASEENTSNESMDLKPIEFSYPQYYLLKFFKSAKNITTKSGIARLKELYNYAYSELVEEANDLVSELDRLKSRYEAL